MVVVADGRVVEVGAHQELLDRGGAYAALWASFTGQAVAPTAAAT